MCGRSASSRNSEKVSHACAYIPRGRTKPLKPPWLNCSSLKYHPSYNVSPQMNTPILLSSRHTHVKQLFQKPSEIPSVGDISITTATSPPPPPSDTPSELGERVLQVMKWGLVPSWRKPKESKSPLLNNCRLEGLLEKPSFRNAVEKRRRCVVLADGFFEWDRKGKQKRPYFIHFRDNAPTSEMKALEVLREDLAGAALQDSHQSIKVDHYVVNGRLLTMAGLFDICMQEAEGSPLYSYTTITLEAHPDFSPIHDRMPAILDGDEAIQTWLDPSLSTEKAIEILHPSSSLTWYPVSDIVNNVKNKTPECIMKIDPTREVSRQQKTLFSWLPKQKLNTGVPKNSSQPHTKLSGESRSSPPAKKQKTDQ